MTCTGNEERVLGDQCRDGRGRSGVEQSVKHLWMGRFRLVAARLSSRREMEMSTAFRVSRSLLSLGASIASAIFHHEEWPITRRLGAFVLAISTT